MTYFITVIVLFVAPLLFMLGEDTDYFDFTFYLMILCIPYIAVGLLIWVIIRIKYRPVALGILLGSLTPFIVTFIMIGGSCFLSPFLPY